MAPNRITGVIGVAKAYVTRVGGGPFPTEALDGAGERIRERGKEFGAVTGRPRRCGWFDAPLMKYTAAINGFDSIVVTKLDVLDEFDKIPVCVGYRIGGREVTEMPPTVAEVEKIEPVYECMPGWSESTFGISSYDDLPAKAKDYLAFLEERSGVEVGCISTGPERNQTIVRKGSRLEKLIELSAPILQHQLSAVNLDRFANHVAGGFGDKKRDDLRAFHRCADAAQRNALDEAGNHFRRRENLVKRSIDYAGRDRVDADAARRQFFRHRFGERDQPGLRRGVGAGAGAAAIASGDGYHVDDGARLPLHHRRRDGLRAQHGALKVEVHDFVPARFGDLGEGQARHQRARVVDQNIQVAERLGGARHQRRDLGGVAHVGLEGDRLAAA